MRKLCETLRQAMEQAGLRDGMTISFHHHLRNGDYVLNMVLDEAAKMGVKDLTVNASSVFDCYEPMLDHIRNGVVTGLETDYIAPGIGRELSKGAGLRLCRRHEGKKSGGHHRPPDGLSSDGRLHH